MSTVLVPQYDDEGAVMPVPVPDWILSQIDLSRPEQVHCHERTADVRRSGSATVRPQLMHVHESMGWHPWHPTADTISEPGVSR